MRQRKSPREAGRNRQRIELKLEAGLKLSNKGNYESEGLRCDIFCMRLYPIVIVGAAAAAGLFLFQLFNEYIDFGAQSLELALADTANTLIFMLVMSAVVIGVMRYRILVLARYAQIASGKSLVWLAATLLPVAGLVLVALAVRSLSVNSER